MSIKAKIMGQLRHALLESGPSCVQLVYSLRDCLLGILLLSGVNYVNVDAFHAVNQYSDFSGGVLLGVGLLGLGSLLLDKLIGGIAFSGLNVFLFGYASYSCLAHGEYMGGVNFLFEMFVVCWLTFRLQYDQIKRATIKQIFNP